MSELLDRIPGEWSALAIVQESSENVAAFKSRQRTTGRSGQLGYLIESSQEWDVVLPLPPTAQGNAQPVEFRLTFTGDGSQEYPIVVPATEVRANGVPLTLNYQGRYMYQSGGNVVQMYQHDFPESLLLDDKRRQSWLVAFDYMGNVTVRLKARGRGSSNGSWSFERLK